MYYLLFDSVIYPITLYQSLSAFLSYNRSYIYYLTLLDEATFSFFYVAPHTPLLNILYSYFIRIFYSIFCTIGNDVLVVGGQPRIEAVIPTSKVRDPHTSHVFARMYLFRYDYLHMRAQTSKIRKINSHIAPHHTTLHFTSLHFTYPVYPTRTSLHYTP